MVAKGLPATESVPCEAKATSDAHQLCVVLLVETSANAAKPVETSASAPKPAKTSASAAKPVETSASAAKAAETSASAAKLVETSASAAKPAESQPAAAAKPLDDYGKSEYVALRDSEPEPDAGGGAEKPAHPSFSIDKTNEP